VAAFVLGTLCERKKKLFFCFRNIIVAHLEIGEVLAENDTGYKVSRLQPLSPIKVNILIRDIVCYLSAWDIEAQRKILASVAALLKWSTSD